MTSPGVLRPPAGRQPRPDVELKGTVERVTFSNPENGFTVARLRVRGHREPVTVVGTLPAVQPGETLSLVGQWQTDPRHGTQFRPVTAVVEPPSEREEIVRYLGSGLIYQLGPVLARRIVDTFGAATLEVLDQQPGRVREVPGIGPQRARALAEALTQHRALREVSAFLSAHAVDRRYAPRLVSAYGEDAPRVLAANPYRLVAEVPGFGFGAADRLGRSLGLRPTGAARLQAAVHGAMLRATERGHTRLPRRVLVEQAAALAGVDPELVDGAVTQLTAGGVLAGQTAASGEGQPAPGSPGPLERTPPPVARSA
ncbi:MAG TPA: ATP-dependent RecD-like DNA helicase, partial [Chloroflexota bacterium]|nr:ATP-dependent RecD-like DNA helicase [Chloroflexota bacterium]